jgi:hypothetical protein
VVKLTSGLALAPFQRACANELLSLAAEQQATVDQEEPAGQKETYLVVNVTAANGLVVKAWIYPDECMLTADGRSFYFEKPDFQAAADLRSAFIAVASDLLQGKEPQHLNSSRFNLFRGRPL